MMTANHRNGGRAVGAGTSDLRNPPAIQEAHDDDLIAFMRRYGLHPAQGMEFVTDGVLRHYRVKGDPIGIERGVYIAHCRNWEFRVVAFGLESVGILDVWPTTMAPDQRKAARSVSAWQFKQRHFGRKEVAHG